MMSTYPVAYVCDRFKPSSLDNSCVVFMNWDYEGQREPGECVKQFCRETDHYAVYELIQELARFPIYDERGSNGLENYYCCIWEVRKI